MTSNRDFHGPNLGYILELYERFQDDPDSVDEAARKLFQHWTPTFPAGPTLQATPSLPPLSKAADLAQAIRSRGYLVATLDPLGSDPIGDPSLTLDFHNLSADDLRQLPAEIIHIEAENAWDAIQRLRSIYSQNIGYDYGHIRIPEERTWLYQAAENGRFRIFSDETKLLERLTQVEAFELSCIDSTRARPASRSKAWICSSLCWMKSSGRRRERASAQFWSAWPTADG